MSAATTRGAAPRSSFISIFIPKFVDFQIVNAYPKPLFTIKLLKMEAGSLTRALRCHFTPAPPQFPGKNLGVQSSRVSAILGGDQQPRKCRSQLPRSFGVPAARNAARGRVQG